MYRFTDDCLIGVDVIDNEHKRLFSMINEAIEMAEKGETIALRLLKNLISNLKEYAITHFAHEEEYMRKTGDAELERQIREHEQFSEYVEKYSRSWLSEENAKEKIVELLAYLSRWLYRHILGSDIMIGYNTGGKREINFEFSEIYHTGIEIIDDEHRRLFEIIKETNDLMEEKLLHDKYDGIVHILGELKSYTIKHFADEEEYMESIGYEGLEAQKVAHMAFMDRLNDIDLDSIDNNQQEYICELINYLLRWLSTHILKMDKKIPKS